jgi:hypothetical protein
MSCPSILGGYPVIKFWDMVVHGFPDPLTINIRGIMTRIKEETSPLIKLILTRILNPPINPDPNFEMLCQDPLSLNLLHGSSAPDKVKRMVFDFLCASGESIIKNCKFKEFLSIAKKTQTELSSILSHMHPLHPKIASSILESTVVGRAMKVISKINKTNTLIKLMLRHKSNAQKEFLDKFSDPLETEVDGEMRDQSRISFFKLFGKFEQNFFNGIVNILSNSKINDKNFSLFIPHCSLTHAQTLRKNSWKRDLEGVSVAVPWELLSCIKSKNANCKVDGHENDELGYFLTTVLGQDDIKIKGRKYMGTTTTVALIKFGNNYERRGSIMAPSTPETSSGTQSPANFDAYL